VIIKKNRPRGAPVAIGHQTTNVFEAGALKKIFADLVQPSQSQQRLLCIVFLIVVIDIDKNTQPIV
jgi:hypothetical protein